MGNPTPAPLQDAAIDEVIAAYDGNTQAAASAVASHHSHPAIKGRAGESRNRSTGVSASILTLAAVSLYYREAGQTKPVVHDVSLAVHTSEILAVCGPDGAGKSTLLELMGGLTRPDAGDISIAGRSLSGLSDSQLREMRRSLIGFVVSANYVIPELTVAQNMEVPAIFADISRPRRQERSEELLHAVGLIDQAGLRGGALSPAQNQRLAIARAFINQPRIIIADEPTRQLEASDADRVIELYQALQATYRTTFVVGTSDTRIAALADRSFTMVEGSIAT